MKFKSARNRLAKAAAVLFFISVIVLDSAYARNRQSFQDFSQHGKEYTSLEDLRLSANEVNYSGTESIEIFGKTYTASKYILSATVKRFFVEDVEEYERVSADYKILVVEDSDRTIHNSVVNAIYETWKRKKLFSGQYFFSFLLKKSETPEYLLTWMPDGSSSSSDGYFFWVHGRAVKFSFLGFRDGKRGGAETDDILRVRLGQTNVRAYEFPLSIRKEFLKLYESGYFGVVSK